MAWGAAAYELQPDLQTIERLWGRDDLTCGTSIPLIANGAAYCVGFPRYSVCPAFSSL